MNRLLQLVRRHVTYANSMATIAVLIAAAGTAHAAGIGSAGIADNSIQSRDIRNGAIGSIDLASGGVRLVDIDATARAALRGRDGVDGRDGAPGQPGERGPIGPQGPAGEDGVDGQDGTTFDDLMDLETLSCSADGRAGTVDVVLGAPGVTDFSSITLRCALEPPAPLECTGGQPANATSSCNTSTGQWEIVDCNPGFYDLNNNQADGCEYAPGVPYGEEVCDGKDNDHDGSVDEGLIPPQENQTCVNGQWQ